MIRQLSVLDIGARSRLMAAFNRYPTRRVFPEALLRAWMVRNVEEVGYLEHLLTHVIDQRPDVASSTGRVEPALAGV